MLYIRQNRILRLVVLPLTLVAMSACQTTGWKSAGFAPFDTRRDLPSPARLTLNDRSTVELVGARFEADSIIGTRTAGVVTTSRRWAVPVDSVRHIESQKIYVSGGRQALLIGAGILAVAFVITLIEFDNALSNWGSRP